MYFEAIVAAVGVMVALPVLVFFCAKLGRFGYLAGESRWHQRKDGSDGTRP